MDWQNWFGLHWEGGQALGPVAWAPPCAGRRPSEARPSVPCGSPGRRSRWMLSLQTDLQEASPSASAPGEGQGGPLASF